MKNKLLITALTLGLFVSVVWAQQPKSQTFEYKFDNKCTEKRANDFAAEGWDLFSMSMGTWGNISTPTCVFRRAK
jgi:hypothetical protein